MLFSVFHYSLYITVLHLVVRLDLNSILLFLTVLIISYYLYLLERSKFISVNFGVPIHNNMWIAKGGDKKKEIYISTFIIKKISNTHRIIKFNQNKMNKIEGMRVDSENKFFSGLWSSNSNLALSLLIEINSWGHIFLFISDNFYFVQKKKKTKFKIEIKTSYIFIYFLKEKFLKLKHMLKNQI